MHEQIAAVQSSADTPDKANYRTIASLGVDSPPPDEFAFNPELIDAIGYLLQSLQFVAQSALNYDKVAVADYNLILDAVAMERSLQRQFWAEKEQGYTGSFESFVSSKMPVEALQRSLSDGTTFQVTFATEQLNVWLIKQSHRLHYEQLRLATEIRSGGLSDVAVATQYFRELRLQMQAGKTLEHASNHLEEYYGLPSDFTEQTMRYLSSYLENKIYDSRVSVLEHNLGPLREYFPHGYATHNVMGFDLVRLEDVSMEQFPMDSGFGLTGIESVPLIPEGLYVLHGPEWSPEEIQQWLEQYPLVSFEPDPTHGKDFPLVETSASVLIFVLMTLLFFRNAFKRKTHGGPAIHAASLDD